MALRVQRLKEVSRFCTQIFSGSYCNQSEKGIALHASFSTSSLNARTARLCTLQRGCNLWRFSTLAELRKCSPEVALLSFIKYVLDKNEGPNHCWLNKIEGAGRFYKQDDIFLVLTGVFSEDTSILGCDPVVIFEKVKLLQQRYPQLNVIGFQAGNSVCSMDYQAGFVQKIVKEFICFPILLSNRDLDEMTNQARFILFKDFQSPLQCEIDVDLKFVYNAIEELLMQSNRHLEMMKVLKCSCFKEIEVFNEPSACSSMRNLFLYYPGCISVDESGSRLFLSDCNHHRIIVFDGNGKILDCIGSSPGFEDGEFESAKLARPAASFYHASEDCLYFVDSENHAVRQANLGKRILETVHPSPADSEKSGDGLWSLISTKLGLGASAVTEGSQINLEPITFPWHLMKSEDGSFLIMNRSFEVLWILDVASKEIKEVISGFPKIWELCGQMIMEKLSILKQIPSDRLKQLAGDPPLKGIPYIDLLSSSATFTGDICFCDTVGHRVLRYCKESGVAANFKFSNFGILRSPYWIFLPVEKAFNSGNSLPGPAVDHLRSFTVLPGRVDVKLTVDIPGGTQLAEPIPDDCIWQQARGCAVVLYEGIPSAKVSLTQQFYDDIDNTFFYRPEAEPGDNFQDDNVPSVQDSAGDEIHIDCSVDTSPGTSEVIIRAAIYLKLSRCDGNEEDNASRIVNILNPKMDKNGEGDACMRLLSQSDGDLCEIVFVRPLHVKLRFDCLDQPSGQGRDTEVAEYELKVRVPLDSSSS